MMVDVRDNSSPSIAASLYAPHRARGLRPVLWSFFSSAANESRPVRNQASAGPLTVVMPSHWTGDWALT
jgi:hypothetical protein